MYLQNNDRRWQTDGNSGSVPAAPVSLASDSGLPNINLLPTIAISGVTMHAIDERTCIAHILQELTAGRGGVVVTPNLDHLRRCLQDVSFAALVAEADLVVADGMPLVWASRLQGTPLPQRVAGSDLINSLSAAAAGQGRSIFLLGGDEGTAESAAKILCDRYPQLKIAGIFFPPPGFERSDALMQRMLDTLTAAKPDIVFVALGSPKQERVIDRIRRSFPATWWLGVGVSFSFLSGDVRRAPVWMRKIGLEWVHRLIQEPRRLFKRYIVVGLPFALNLLTRAAVKGALYRLGLRQPYMGMKRQFPPALQPVSAAANALVSEEIAAAKVVRGDSGIGPFRAEHVASHEAHVSSSSGTGRLQGLILLGGAVRPSALATAVDRSVLDLPMGNGRTVLTRWLDEADDVAQMFRLDRLPVRLLIDSAGIAPRSGDPSRYSVERDTSEYRGTGGLLANIAIDYADDDLILIGNAAQVLLDPLPAIYASLRKTGGIVGLIGHRDGTPGGMMLVTCKTLRLIPNAGFVDMKEQALPMIAERYDVRVIQCRRPTGLPIRSMTDYITALRGLHQPAGRPATADPLAEDWKSTFAIVEPGATVAPSARVHDSVVLAGAIVEPGAVVVRSVVAGIVRKDDRIVDECVELMRSNRIATPVGRAS